MLSISCALLLALVFSCKNEKKPAGPVEVVTGSLEYNKTEGPGCGQPDTLRTDCASVSLSWSNVEKGPDALKKSVSAWSLSYLSNILGPPSDVKLPSQKSVEAAAAGFFKAQQEFAKEAPGSPAAYYTAESSDEVLLNDGLHLTLEITGYTYMGGAHGSPTAAVATFESPTGKILTLTDLVTDTAAFKTLAEQAFRDERADIFQPTDGSEPYEFNETFPFALPQNFGLTADGIYCHYLAYEVGPYAIGSTQFTIPFEALGKLLKIQPPVQTGSSSEVPEFYEVQGGSVVIPAFEIEVRTSKKAAQTLQKNKETIIVAAMFYGFPASEKDADETGQMSILNKNIELTGNQRLARFEGLNFSKKQLAKLKDKDMRLLINVYSGRKSSENNLLSCGLADVPASQFGGKRYSLQCNLIEESPNANDGPAIAYALPAPGGESSGPLPLSVECNEQGEIFWLGNPVKDLNELVATLRPVLEDLKKSGAKELPGIQTTGCMMGNGGAIRDAYEELKNELSGKGNASAKPAEMEKPVEKITPKQAPAAPATKSNTTAKTSTKATKSTTSAKTTVSKTSAPAVTLNQKGEITLDGKKVTLENLRKELQAALLKQTTIPDKLELKTIGETGMGMRGEVNTVITESINGAKWLRKKTAIETLNTAVGKKLKTSTQLELGSYQTSGEFAFISAKPKQADGKAIDYSKTDYAKDAKSASFADHTIGLLKFENGTWKIVTYSIGVSKPPVDVWVKNFKAPKTLFGK
jgi:hypothetical protein